MLRRIKNIWKLSNYTPALPGDKLENMPEGTQISILVNKPVKPSVKMAQIIKRKEVDPIEEVIKYEN